MAKPGKKYIFLIALVFIVSIPIEFIIESIIEKDFGVQNLPFQLLRYFIVALVLSGLFWIILRGVYKELYTVKELEVELKRSEDKYQIFSELTSDYAIILTLTPDNTLTVDWCTKSFEQICGYTRNELNSTLFWDHLIYPEDKPYVLAQLKVLLAGEDINCEYRVITGNNETRWLRTRCRPEWDAEKKLITRILVAGQDATRSRVIEQELKESEARYRSVVNSLQEGIVFQDENGKIVALNESAERILGRSAEQLAGCTLQDFNQHTIHEDGTLFPGDEHPAMVTLRTGQPCSDVIMGVKTPNDQFRWISVNSQPLFHSEKDSPYAVVASFTDITARREAELALKQSKENLAHSEIWLHTILDNTPEAFALLDRNYSILAVNNGCRKLVREIFDFEIKEGDRLNELFLPLNERDFYQNYNLVLNGETVTTDYTVHDKTGVVRWFQLSYIPVLDDTGQINHVCINLVEITRLKQNEAQLREQNRLLEEDRRFIQRLTEATPEIITIIDLETGQSVYNNYKNLLGYDYEQFTQNFHTLERLFEAIHPDDLPDLIENNNILLVTTDNKVVESEFRIMAADGNWHWFSTRAVVFNRSLEGKVTQILGATRDITERKRIEEELARQRDFAMQVVNLMGQGLAITDLKGRFQFVNPAICELFGFSPGEFYGKTTRDIVFSDDYERLSKAHSAYTGTKSISYEVRIKRRDGLISNILITVSPYYQNKVRTGDISVITNLDNLKEYENALLEAKERYQELFASAKRQALELELLHRIRTYLSQALEPSTLIKAVVDGISETFGYTHVSLYLRNGDTMFLQSQNGYDTVISTIPLSKGVIGRVARTGKPELIVDVRNEANFLGAVEGITSEIAIPIIDQNQVIGVLNVESSQGIEFNESDLRLMINLGEHLNQAYERTRLYSELIVAREEALSSSRLKSEFLANMSHEIRTPLNAITGATELLQTTSLNQSQRELLDLTRKSTEMLLALINDILDLSKIEANKMALETIDFDVVRLVEETLDIIRPKASEKGLLLLSYIDPKISDWVTGDPTRLRQVLLNLLSNAVKFTEQGEVVLKLEQHEINSKQVRLQFEVRDTGIGISPIQLRNLFTSFNQADNSTTRRYGGTGLGLAISKQLIHLMNGEIEVLSQLGNGSTFRFYLSLNRGRKSTGKLNTHPQLINELARLRVLVVDTSASHAEILKQYLVHWGVTVDLVTNGHIALKRLYQMAAKGLFYHIALIDSSLTDIGVDELARLVHHDVTLNNLELVKLNSFEQSETGRNNNSELFSKHLYKPVRQSNLLDCLTQVTQGTKSEEQTSILNTDEAEKVQATYSSRRILLVEDNPVNQKLTVKQLEKLGYTSEVAENGMKALDLHSKSDYDLILMDCQMPEMDGYATTRLIRQSENGSGNHIPIVALTADALLGDREKCLEVGMDDYLSKPVSISQLRHVLERWLVDENRDITKMPANEPTNIETSQNSGSRTPVVNQTLPVSGEPVLRYQVLADLRSIQDPQSPDLVNEVIDLFLENSPGWMEELREAISKLEYIKIYQTAHRLKGASSNLGAVAFASVCYKLEKMGKECSFEGLEKQITNLENTYEQLREALQTVKI